MKKLLLFCLVLHSVAQAQTTETFNYTGSIETWTVPNCVTSITIQTLGAQGGTNASSGIPSGFGASMTGTFTVTPGQQIKLLVGQQPGAGSGNGGGGGTFVVDLSNNPMIISGGGGGSASTTDSPSKHGQITTAGGTGAAGGGIGGDFGNGGSIGASGFQSGAGGGLITNGADGWTSGTGGFSFLNGGSGGATNAPANGGFGGGGSGSSYVVGGGGGGYSGGGSGGNSSAGVGGGGGSYNAGTNQINLAGVNSGNGIIYITYETNSGAPAVPSAISGMISLCEGTSGVIYTVDNDPSATSYFWTVPGDFNLVSGQGTNSIELDAGLTGGDLTVVATNGCGTSLPSTIAIEINSHSTGTDIQSACDSYLWIDGNTYTSSNNSATFMLQNNAGCDSLVTLDLTMTYNTSSSFTETACDTYTLNGQTYTETGIYTQNLPNDQGCDSTITLDLTINTTPIAFAVDNGDGTISVSGGTTVQWIDCSNSMNIPGEENSTFAPTNNGIYGAVVSENGCSSTSNCVEIDYLSLEMNEFDPIALYPNPTNSNVTIELNQSEAKLIVRDSQGKELQSLNVVSGQTIQMDGFENGLYLFEFTTELGTQIYSVIKQ